MNNSLVISAGHSTTQVAWLSSEGLQISSGEGVNLHHTTPDQATTIIKALVAKLNIGDTTIDRCVLVLPGVSTSADLDDANELLRRIIDGKSVKARRVIDDTIAALIANTGTMNGVVAIAGSGASVFCGGNLRRPPSPACWPYKMDGWGPILGDRGGGTYVGFLLLQRTCQSFDETGEPPAWISSLDDCQFAVEDIQNWFDQLLRDEPIRWRTELAQLAKVVTERLREHPDDEFCKSIVNQAAREIAGTINTAIDFHNAEGLPVICYGGMFFHSDDYFQNVTRSVNSTYDSPVELADYRPIVGGLAVCISESWEPTDTAQIIAFADTSEKLSAIRI